MVDDALRQLEQAIKKNDPEAARTAIWKMRSVNRKIAGSTPLMLACEMGSDAVIDVLLDAGADPSARYAGESAFVVALVHEHIRVAEKLAERTTITAEQIKMALDDAAMEGRETVVRFLLERFNPPIPPSVMHVAPISKNAAILRMLVEHGGDINAASEEVGADRATPIHGAAARGDVWAIRALAECGADVNARDRYGRTPLVELVTSIHALALQSVMLGFLKQLEATVLGDTGPSDAIGALDLLLELGADASLTDYYGNDVIFHYESDMARSDAEPDREVIAKLTGAGAPGSGATGRLFEAIQKGNVAGVRKAVSDGADVDRVNPAPVGMTPLMLASQSTELVQILLDAGADPNKPGLHGTPLISAAFGGCLPVVKQLIAAGADVEGLEPDEEDDSVRRNAYLAAELNRKHEVMDYLKSLGSGRPKPKRVSKIQPGVGQWENFSEYLIRADASSAAAALARMIGGRVQENVCGKSLKPGDRAYVVAMPKGLNWTNVFRIAPDPEVYEDQDKVDRFCLQLARESGASVLYVAYNDTAGAAVVMRYEPGASEPRVHEGDPEESVEYLESLAKDEKFAVAEFGIYCEPGRSFDIGFLGYTAGSFGGVAFVSD